MFEYTFYRKDDLNRERFTKRPAKNIEEAISTFAKLKNLPEKIFLTLYRVEIYERSN